LNIYTFPKILLHFSQVWFYRNIFAHMEACSFTFFYKIIVLHSFFTFHIFLNWLFCSYITVCMYCHMYCRLGKFFLPLYNKFNFNVRDRYNIIPLINSSFKGEMFSKITQCDDYYLSRCLFYTHFVWIFTLSYLMHILNCNWTKIQI
jgi:hypothetical protein